MCVRSTALSRLKALSAILGLEQQFQQIVEALLHALSQGEAVAVREARDMPTAPEHQLIGSVDFQ